MDFINSLIEYAKDYGVNPIIFLVVYFGSTPFLLIPVYFLLKMAKEKKLKCNKKSLFLIAIVAAAWFAPYLYVILYSRGVNPIILFFIAVIAVITFIRYLKKKLKPK
jgi:Trk-type K+ transport system membrane component